MYTSEHDSYLRLKDGKFEVQPTLSRGQWGASQDDAGRIYRNTNEAALHVDLVPTRYFMRNPNLLRTRGSYESLENDDESTPSGRCGRRRGVNRGYQDGMLRPDGTLAQLHVGVLAARSTAAIACPRSCTATSSSPSPPRIS